MTETTTLTPEACREALKKVIDPEIYQSIVDLGLVYGITVDDDNQVVVDMTLTTPHCPLAPQIIADVERMLIAKGASAVTVNIVWDPPWTPAAMTEELQRELGVIADEEDEEEEYEPIFTPPPPPPPKKKGFFSRLFGG
jgi:metal-sulfur cluster biosynthetic enzyme